MTNKSIPFEARAGEKSSAFFVCNDFQRSELILLLEPLIHDEAEKRKHGGQGGVLLKQNSAEGKRRPETRDELARLAFMVFKVAQEILGKLFFLHTWG